MDRPDLEDVDLNTTDRLIIAKLREGRATPGYLADELGKRQSYINQRLGPLVEGDLVKKVDRGLYGLAATEGSGVDAQELADRLDDEDLVGGRVRPETGEPADRPPEEPALSDVNPGVEPDGPERTAPDNTPTPPAPDVEESIDTVVDRIAAQWGDRPARVDERKAAARAVLEYAREHGDVSKQEAIDEIEPEYPVTEQNPETWYRKNARPVLRSVCEYDSATRSYHYPEGGLGGDRDDEADTNSGGGGVYDPTEEF